MKKILSLVLALAMLCAAVPAAMAQTEITFWHTYSEGEEKVLTEDVIPAFEAANPDIKVNAVRMPYEGLNEQFITAVAGDVAPDVIRMDLTWVAQMAKLGALAQVDTLPGFDAILADALPGPMATTEYKGGHYGLPLNTNTTAAVFNLERLKALGFDAPPATMDELLAAADAPETASQPNGGTP